MKYYSDGIDKKTLFESCRAYAEEHLSSGIVFVKKQMIPKLAEESILSISKDTRFFGDVDCNDVSWGLRNEFWTKNSDKYVSASEIDPFRAAANKPNVAIEGGHDYSHTAPNWQNVMTLGIAGLRQRAVSALNTKRAWTDSEREFFELVINHYDSALKLIERMKALAAEVGVEDELLLPGLDAMTERAPKTLYEAMQTIIVYYVLQQIVDSNPVRTLGRLDSILYPYYKSDIESGILNKEGAEKLTYDFLVRLADFNAIANLPFAICGDYFGKDNSNEYSYLLLEQYEKLSSPNLKMHFLYSGATPKALVRQAFNAIKKGCNSIVFMNDSVVKSAMRALGAEAKDAERYETVGCYEAGALEEITCSTNGKINMAKAIEVALNGGADLRYGIKIGADTPTDFDSFEQFYEAFKTQLAFFAEGAMALVNAKEKSYPIVNTGAYLSSTYDSCMSQGKDAYKDFGAKYNNSSIVAIGTATVADSLYAVKTLVFDEKKLTFARLVEILKNDWKGEEYLLATVRNKLPKYGQNVDEVDCFARDVIAFLGSKINGKPNVKGGKFRLGVFSIDWRFYMGESTSATPDGRRAGEPLSKNTSAGLGRDTEGVTAHMLSMAKINGDDIPDGGVLDLVFHETAVRGKSGEDLLVNTLKTYMERGGFAVHYNVLSPEVLRDAQINPDKYPNLQVRLCGWNVLWNNLSKKEQDEFIFASERAS